MTYEEREKIFSKEVLTIKDIMVLFGDTYQVAARRIREIKMKYDRLNENGKVHVQDYLDYYHITDTSRYFKKEF